MQRFLTKKICTEVGDEVIQELLGKIGSEGYNLRLVIQSGNADVNSLILIFGHGGEDIDYSYRVIITDSVERLESWLNSFDHYWSLRSAISFKQSTMAVMVKVNDRLRN